MVANSRQVAQGVDVELDLEPLHLTGAEHPSPGIFEANAS
jgi:hypothetical protein